MDGITQALADASQDKRTSLIMQRFDITVTVRMAKPQVHNSG